MSQQFIEEAAVDRRIRAAVDYLVDTNVAAEMNSFGDLVRLGKGCRGVEELRRSASFRYRCHRTKHSALLARWFAMNRLRAASFGNEVVDILTERLASVTDVDRLSYALTTAILRVITPFALRGWCLNALADVDHYAKGQKADTEILRIAVRHKLTVITWEGFTEQGIVPDRTKLRDRCVAADVPVFTPEEFLISRCVDIEREARHFLFSCEKAVRTARAQRVLGDSAILDLVVPMYRLVLTGESS